MKRLKNVPAQPRCHAFARSIVRAGNIEGGSKILKGRQHLAVWGDQIDVEEKVQTGDGEVEFTFQQTKDIADTKDWRCFGRLVNHEAVTITLNHFQRDKKVSPKRAPVSLTLSLARSDHGIGKRGCDANDGIES